MDVLRSAVSVPSQTGATPEPRLVRAAQEFEAQMMKELMQPLMHGDALLVEESEQDNALEEFAAESLARGISEQGGFGVAKWITQQVSHIGNGAK